MDCRTRLNLGRPPNVHLSVTGFLGLTLLLSLPPRAELVVEGQEVMLGAPLLLDVGRITELKASPISPMIAYVRTPPLPPDRIEGMDERPAGSREVWVRDLRRPQGVRVGTLGPESEWQVAWLKGGRVAVVSEAVVRDEPIWSIAVVSGAGPGEVSLNPLHRASVVGQSVRLLADPQGERLLLFGQSVDFGPGGEVARETWHLTPLREDGRPLATQTFPRETSGPQDYLWQGDELWLPVVRRGSIREVARIDLVSLSLTYEPDRGRGRPEPPEISVASGPGGLRLASTRATGTIPISLSPGPAALVQGGESVAFVQDQALFVRQIRRVPVAQTNAARYREARGKAERQARDIGRAVRFFFRDNFMSHPRPGETAAGLAPYLRWDDSLAGFEQAWPGGTLGPNINTAATPFGSVITSVGRAVVMLDGTVVWQDSR
ncbi:MAG: hypothetical protein MH204_07075 [Fimbriimonadaceae bacterium]|nr:hypothetical protein [Fimbriimonadaceae bacterium]